MEASRKISEFFAPGSGHAAPPPRSSAHIRIEVGTQTELTSEEIDKMETKVDREQLTALQEVSRNEPVNNEAEPQGRFFQLKLDPRQRIN